MTAFAQLKPWYFSSWQQAEKHIAARWWYFWSFGFNPPAIDGSSDIGESASTGDSRINQLMNGSQTLQQEGTSGAYTKSPDDDLFQYTGRL